MKRRRFGPREWWGSAEFQTHPNLGLLRYQLGRWKHDLQARALVCGCNPSTAGAEDDDPTIRALKRLLAEYPGFDIVNWEPSVASQPAVLHRWRDESQRQYPDAYRAVQEKNLRTIRDLSARAAVRIVAWGNLVPDVPLTQHVLSAMSLDGEHALLTWEWTQAGSPKHPMARGQGRIKATTLSVWRGPKKVPT